MQRVQLQHSGQRCPCLLIANKLVHPWRAPQNRGRDAVVTGAHTCTRWLSELRSFAPILAYAAAVHLHLERAELYFPVAQLHRRTSTACMPGRTSVVHHHWTAVQPGGLMTLSPIPRRPPCGRHVVHSAGSVFTCSGQIHQRMCSACFCALAG
jgi:hypothetical protein